MSARYEVFEGEPNHTTGERRFYWRLVAANNEVVAQSEAYTRREDAARGAADAQDASLDAEIVRVDP